MILEYYHKPDLVPPFSFFLHVYRIFRKLIDMCQQFKKVTPKDNNISNISTNNNKLNEKGYKIFFG
jgi:hypothetical protein